MLRSKKIYIIPVFGFIAVIAITSVLLKLSICNNNEISTIDAVFEAASMVTATGSTVLNISEQFSFIGQFVMAISMEVGAIGFMLFFSMIFAFSKRKMRLSDNIFLSNEISTTDYNIVKQKAKKISVYTLVIEFFGSWLLAFKFVPIYGFAKGIWYSIFHSISAFCNVRCGYNWK